MHQLTSRFFFKSSVALGAIVLIALCAACSSNSSSPSSAAPGDAPASNASNASPDTAANPANNGGGSAASSGSGIDACKLVTQAEAEQALGQAVEPATQDASSPNRSDCDYISSDNSGSAVVYVLVTSSDHAKRDFEFAKAAVRGPQTLSGIGQDAFALQLDAPVAQVHFIKGGSYVTLVVTNLADPARLEKAKALAVAAAGRI